MRILADENIPRTLVRLLREGGHDVLSVREDLRGERDRIILLRAEAEKRLVITQDKDFGELARENRTDCEDQIEIIRKTGIPEQELPWCSMSRLIYNYWKRQISYY